MPDEEKEANLKKYGSIYPDSILVNSNPWITQDMYKTEEGMKDEPRAILWGIRQLIIISVSVVALSFGISLLLF